jgi:hypothetical protein
MRPTATVETLCGASRIAAQKQKQGEIQMQKIRLSVNRQSQPAIRVDALMPSLQHAVYQLDGTFDYCGSDAYTTPTAEQLQLWSTMALDFAKQIEKHQHWLKQTYYIRFNDLPKNGISKNHATGEYEKGVSCYGAEFDLTSETFKILEDGTDCSAAIGYAIERANVYLLTGDCIDRGSDGEPVLANVKIVSQLKYDVDRDGFIQI